MDMSEVVDDFLQTSLSIAEVSSLKASSSKDMIFLVILNGVNLVCRGCRIVTNLRGVGNN